jgi:DNA-3-methyladenine glycosylase II
MIAPTGPFSLAQAASFGFGPREAEASGAMRLAFAADGSGIPTGVTLREASDGTIEGEVAGDASIEDVREQVARILSLEHDGDAWQQVGRRDPVLGELQARFPGLRPVLFHSPYEAAAWAVIVARSGRAQAKKVRRTISERHGGTFELAGETLAAFPSAEALLEIDEPIPSLTNEKRLRLQGIARAELEGRLDVAHLRELGPEGALAELQELRGIGPFSSSLIVLRAVGFTDVLPVDQPVVQRAVEHAYAITEPLTAEQFAELAEPWRPFRTWATVLLRIAGDRAGATAHTRYEARNSSAAAAATSRPHTSEST